MEEVETIEEISDEVVEEKKTVKEILIEMKNTAEIMVDLAYSALLTNNLEVAEDVVEMERHMDKLRYEIEMKTMLSARNQEDAEDLAGILHVAQAAEKISNAAEDIVDVVIRGEGDHPILISMVTESDERIVKVELDKKSILVGKTIGGLRIASHTGAYIVAVKRNKKWFYRPDKRFALKERDILLASGGKESNEILKDLADGKRRKL